MGSNIQDTILRIQEEAKRKVQAARYSKSKPSAKVAVAPVASSSPTLDNIVASVREQLATAVTQALSNKAARQYIGDITEELQSVATDVIEANRSSFGGTFQEGKNVVIYPNNCKLLVQNNEGKGCVIIEEPPQYRTVLSRHTGRTQHFRIPLPYMVYIVSFFKEKGEKGRYILDTGGGGIGFGKKPIDSIDCQLYLPSLPHTTGNTHVCQPLEMAEHKNIKNLAESFVATFWNSVFHYHFDNAQKFDVGGKRITGFEDWEKIKNPLDILKGDFRRGSTIKDLLTSI